MDYDLCPRCKADAITVILGSSHCMACGYTKERENPNRVPLE